MLRRPFQCLSALMISLFVGASAATAQELSSPEVRMAQTILRVCLESMQSPRVLRLEDFGEQFVVHEVEGEQIWLRHARGQPWIHLSINGSRAGACGANFSASGRHSPEAARQMGALLRQRTDMQVVSVPGIRTALTFAALGHPFDHERDPYIGYMPVAGYQMFIFMPPAPVAVEQAPSQ